MREEMERPNRFYQTVIAIGFPDGHNYVRSKSWKEDVTLEQYHSKPQNRQQTTDTDGFLKPAGYRRPEAEGKSFYQLYLCFHVFILISTILQV